MSTSLLLSDLLKNNGIDPKKIVLVRHVLNREDFTKTDLIDWRYYNYGK